VPVKSKVKISQNFVAFSEYMNFKSYRSLFSIAGVPAACCHLVKINRFHCLRKRSSTRLQP
jgi:hypothetical protein